MSELNISRYTQARPTASPITTPTTVVNVKFDPHDVYIGRAMPGYKESEYANPFKITEDNTTARVAAVRKFALHSYSRLMRIGDLRGKRIGCWCAPKACHGDYLATLADHCGHHDGACPKCGDPVGSGIIYALPNKVVERWQCRHCATWGIVPVAFDLEAFLTEAGTPSYEKALHQVKNTKPESDTLELK